MGGGKNPSDVYFGEGKFNSGNPGYIIFPKCFYFNHMGYERLDTADLRIAFSAIMISKLMSRLDNVYVDAIISGEGAIYNKYKEDICFFFKSSIKSTPIYNSWT